MLDKKQIQAIFLFEFKIGCKAAQTTRNIKNSFGQGAASKGKVQWWFKKFCKEDKSLENEKCSGWPSEVDSDQLRAIFEADPLTTKREVAKEFNIDHSGIMRHSKQIGNVKKLSKWLPHELTKNQKNHCFEVLSSLILCKNDESFLNQIVTCDEKWILYNNQLSGWTEKKLQSSSQIQTCTRKMSWSLFVVCCQSNPLQFSESQQNHHI